MSIASHRIAFSTAGGWCAAPRNEQMLARRPALRMVRVGGCGCEPGNTRRTLAESCKHDPRKFFAHPPCARARRAGRNARLLQGRQCPPCTPGPAQCKVNRVNAVSSCLCLAQSMKASLDRSTLTACSNYVSSWHQTCVGATQAPARFSSQGCLLWLPMVLISRRNFLIRDSTTKYLYPF